MKYQIGDTVLILHSEEEGQIVDIINDKMAMVEVRGVRFPVYFDQMDFPYFKRFSQKKQQPARKEKKYIDDLRPEKTSPVPRKVDGVWLSFLPVMDTDEFGDEVVITLKLHLINHTEEAYQFDYQLHFFGQKDFELRNSVQPFHDFYLHDIPFSDLNDSPSYHIDFSLVKPDKKKASHYETSLKIKPKQFFARIEEIRKQNLATFSYKLFDTYPNRAEEDTLELGSLAAKGFKVYDAREARRHLEPARSVVDLHIEKLSDNWEHMSNLEILGIQLSTFEKFYELAVAHHLPKLTIIHGVGEGRLRDEIHELLRMKKEVKTYINQYDPRYGYGATEIWLKG
ncbi:MAG: Smr/MutS family protein [Chitinophagaceae bacterium]|nr:Smr/MutS family protein [Chitinophagaceae bacterium]